MRQLCKGNVAIVKGAVLAGCKAFYGYPITPASEIAEYAALLIPDNAIATDQSRKIVFVVKDDDTVEAKEVALGPLDEGLRVIREGLKAEDRVVIDGIQRARVGAKVSPHAATGGGKT